MSEDFNSEAVAAWIADDPDPACAAELQELLDTAVGANGAGGPARAAARTELADRFAGSLEFGTAGLRGEVAAGPARMNRAVVIRAAAGLSAFLADSIGADFSVVIGCDARWGSYDFARDTAAVVTAAGGRAIMVPPQQPTPLTAFALVHLGADAGVMVTASHNPAKDNGYKVYLGHRPLLHGYLARGEAAAGQLASAGAGAQIVPPFDAMIAQRIGQVESVASVLRAETGWEQLDSGIVEDYLDAVCGMDLHARAPVRIVHTALHGVGSALALAALERAGFTDVHPITAQQQPDPEFPTVAFPNPEEPGALDLAFARAHQVGAGLIVANDPDADRFSAAVPDPTSDSGYRQLTGDEVGLLLGEFIANLLDDHAWPAAGAGGVVAPVFANSIVSSRGLAAVAKAHGIEHHATLTGFKWISRVPGLVYGYEEALGYCVAPQLARDKDGISAGIVLATLASRLAANGQSLDDELTRIRARDGVFLTSPLTFRVDDLDLITHAMTHLRATPPRLLGRTPVAGVHDLAEGLGEVPPTDGLALDAVNGDRVIIRPSGTEPKLKCYLEAVEPVSDAAGVSAALATAAGRLADIKSRLSADLGMG